LDVQPEYSRSFLSVLFCYPWAIDAILGCTTAFSPSRTSAKRTRASANWSSAFVYYVSNSASKGFSVAWQGLCACIWIPVRVWGHARSTPSPPSRPYLLRLLRTNQDGLFVRFLAWFGGNLGQTPLPKLPCAASTYI
jgi:hypothetical protein